MRRKVQVIDCTLRDGEQSPGVVFHSQEKIDIATALSDAGVHTLDAGFPAVSVEERNTLTTLMDLGLRARIGATARTLRTDLDVTWQCGIPTAFVFHPASDIHIKAKFDIEWSEVCSRVADACSYGTRLGLNVIFVAEDSARQETSRVAELCSIAADSGAKGVILCDTVGVLTPTMMSEQVRGVGEVMQVSIPLGVHCHNDFGLATANTVAAVQAGCEIVTVTVNGIGERAGNASLEETVAALEVLLDIDTGVDLRMLPEISAMVELASGFFMSPCKAVVGRNVFTHESGVHVHGMAADPQCYEALPPSRLGRTSRFVLGKHSGKLMVHRYLQEHNISASEDEITTILARVKEAKVTQSKSCFEEVETVLNRHYREMINFSEPVLPVIVKEVLGNG